jgi:formate hydrogenlyase subunit 3/multisubunit Na+/H+ antiporter MnhD subunit
MSGVLGAGYLLLLLAALAGLVRPRPSAAVAAAGASLLAVAGATAAGGWGASAVDVGTWLGFGDARLVADRLSGLFLAVLGGIGAALALALLRRPGGRLVAVLQAGLLLAIATVIGADQAFLFLLAWEGITVAIYLAGSTQRDREPAQRSAFVSAAVTKAGGAALLGAFGLLYAASGSFRLQDWARAAAQLDPDVRNAAFVLFLVGFGTKIGMVPFQPALPAAYSGGPAALAATTSLAVLPGFYGLWRLVADTLAPGPLWWGEVTLLIGALGAIVGILYALAQDDMRRFLGFSSVEHSGIALLGFAVALIGLSTGNGVVAAAGLLAATLHVIMHAVAKALAFLGAARVAEAAGTESMEPLGGLARPMPGTAAGLGLAVLTLAAIPPFAGFVSEWLTLQALLQGFRLDSTVARLVMALGAAMLALTAGLALLAFAKFFGGTMLGRPRSALGHVREIALEPGFVALSGCALVLGALAPWEIRWVGRALTGVLGADPAAQAISHPLVLGPAVGGFSVLAPTWLAIALPGFALIAAALASARARPARRAPVWVSGTHVPAASVQYTPSAYSNPIRVVLRRAFGFSRTIAQVPGERPRLVTRMATPFERHLYEPALRGSLRASALARRLQSGRLGLYLLYVLAVLVAVLALIPALGG